MIIRYRTRLIACLVFFDGIGEQKMMRTRYCTLLLFSFCLLFVGCQKPESNLEELALQGKFELLERIASDDFSRTYQKSSLFYVALAQERQGNVQEAALSLRLYLALAGTQGSSEAAKNLAVLVGNRAGDSALVIEMGLLLEEQQALNETTAKELYQALLADKRIEDAHRVFSTYLKGTLDGLSYAKVLIEAQASFSLVMQALDALPIGDAVNLLLSVSSTELGMQRSFDYYSYAITYERKNLDEKQKQVLYASLARFASQADLRVQANKYQSLAQPLP